MSARLPPVPDRLLACLRPPGATDADRLELSDDGGFRCPRTGQRFAAVDGVPSLFGATSAGDDGDVTGRIKSFYEEHPFPSYEGVEEFGELVSKGIHNPFSANLLKAVGYNKLVLECGCGTGQLSHFLQLNNNHVLGVDMSISSLRLAIEHKQRNQLPRSAFVQMNLFDLAIRDASFDVVISHGVLHHTFDARRAFANIVRKVKPGGIVMVGLYNYYARIPTWMRARLVRVFGPKIDFVVRTRIRDQRKARIWLEDQYANPHETWHSIDDVMHWFDENGIEYMNCSPPILGTDGEDATSLFDRTSPGDRYRRVVTQLGWLGTIAREGALFDLIGRRKATP